jgi:uncharacterized protein YjdB
MTGVSVSWSSDNPSVASVGPTGVLTGGAAGGTAHIRATANGVVSNAVTVQNTASVADNVVASVTVSPTGVTLAASETRQLTAVVKNAAGKVLVGVPITWATDHSDIVSVSPSGVAAAGATAGTAHITATAGTVTSSSLSITSAGGTVPRTPTSISLPAVALALVVGDTRTLVATVLDGFGLAVPGVVATSFTSSDPSIATVTNGGIVTAIAAGTVSIIARYVSGAISLASNAVQTTVSAAPGVGGDHLPLSLNFLAIEVWDNRTAAIPADASIDPDQSGTDGHGNLLIGTAIVPFDQLDAPDMSGFRALLAPITGIVYHDGTATYLRIRDQRDTFRIQTAVGGSDASIDHTAFVEGHTFSIDTLSVKFS